MNRTHKPLYKSLYFQVIVAIVVGVLLGHFYPETGAAMKPLGDGFIKLIKMIIAPIIFCTVVVGIAGMEDMKKVGKTGGLALLYFEIVSTVALIVGLVDRQRGAAGRRHERRSGHARHQGRRRLHQAGPDAEHAGLPAQHHPQHASSMRSPRARSCRCCCSPCCSASALHKFGGRGTLVFDVIEKTSHVLFAIVGIIMKVAPIGAFGAMAFTIGKYGVGSLLSLGKLMGTFYLTCLVFVFVVLGLHRALARLQHPGSSSATSRRSS